MKYVWIAAVGVISMASCNGVAGWMGKDKDSTAQVASTDASAMPVRDWSINESNAYSDLFLDSTALETFIKQKSLDGDDAQAMRSFYAVRNFGYAWVASDGLTDEARGFWNVYQNRDSADNDKSNDRFKIGVDTLLQRDSAFLAADDSMAVQTELGLTNAFIQYAKSNAGNTGFTKQNFWKAIPAKKMDALAWADSVLNKDKDTAQYANNRAYVALKQQLGIYYKAMKGGGQTPITTGNWRKGVSSSAVTQLKKRLSLTGTYPASDTSALFTDSLTAAIKQTQWQFGLGPTGVVNDSLVQALNVPVEERLQQILVNLNRTRWMPTTTDSAYIQVNIPSFMLYAFNGGQKTMEMPVVVGKEGASTVLFEGALNQVVFSPYWNIPQSIVATEIMPAVKKDASYLQKRHMEIVSGKNDSIPQVRQLPGADNALGRVKFLFPNRYDIYLHDTPAKELFARSNRALSHGCIRVAKPDSLAAFVLRQQPEWTTEKIATAMKGDKPQEVKVKQPVTVLITYNTVWADDKGRLQFREDVYGHDKSARQKLFTQGG